MKLAFAAICKPTDSEAEYLDKCLASVKEYVDGIFITQAGPNKNAAVSAIIKKYGGSESFYKWDNSFANARNYNFAQVPKEYDYIFWLDADDTLIGGQKLRATIKAHPSFDTFSFWYNYAFDEWGNPIVVHQKTRVVRNDGCVIWAGDLHEDFAQQRQVSSRHVDGIEVLHHDDYARIVSAKTRNIEVAEAQKQKVPEDPRTYWNLGQSYSAASLHTESIEAFLTFLEKSQSDDEKYIARLRLAENYWAINRRQKSIDELRYAIGMKPDYPDAYIRLGEYNYHMERYADAISLLKQSLTFQPPFYKIMVFNPMEYKYQPLKWLAYSYIAISQPILAHECFKALLKLTPQDKKLQEIEELMGIEAAKHEAILQKYNAIKDLDKISLLTELTTLPDEYKCHPLFVNLRNVNFPKTTSTGKEIAYYCGYTSREWDATAVHEGIGGSEEAVIHLSKLWAQAGYDVTVYNNCGHTEKVIDGVTYKPFYTFNYRDKHDTVIVWRQTKLLDYDINATTILVDLHDVPAAAEFTEKRLAKVKAIFVKSQFHRELLPAVPDDKFVIVPNGIVWADLQSTIKRDPLLLVNTSSPDRSLSALIRLFKRVKEQVPDAKCEWAYGFGVFDSVYKNTPHMMEWKDKLLVDMEEAGIVNKGRVSHEKVAQMYQRGRIFAYPTEFAEIDCISARKAQAAGCIPITTDFAALNETVRHGVKLKSKKTKDTWAQPGQIDFALNDSELEDLWVKAVVKELTSPLVEKTDMRADMKQYDWPIIAKKWTEYV